LTQLDYGKSPKSPAAKFGESSITHTAELNIYGGYVCEMHKYA